MGEILNSKSEIIFKGYVINENGTTYRELTYPTKYLDGTLNQKIEVKDNIYSNANKIIAPDFPYLQFEVGSISGIYTLSLKPTNTDGKYTVMWSDRLPKK